ncbi:MAG: hypothetical protein QNJ46_05275 [Leptolyngbyaceae cyanobacterium MO_188.B28]|nr:hypothetical protein [Leptolyngbyaceae cyanobacterium MO_188.B28]
MHLNYRDTDYRHYSDIIKPRLTELGIHHIRDRVTPKDIETQQKFKDLARLNIKSTLIIDPRGRLTPAKAVDIAKVMADLVEAIEGPNKWDIHPEFTYQGQTFPHGVREFQAELYTSINGRTQS